MNEQDTSNSASAHSLGTTEEELAKIKEDKAALVEAQEKAGESRPKSEEMAEDATTVNAENEEPIDPQMPNMPPA
jgi:hypothetical protein